MNRSVSRVLATSLLAGAWMVALSFPIIDLFRGGSFKHADAVETSEYFTIFAVSIAAWAAQQIYSRSFYAAGNTVTPAIAGWAVTLVSIPVYAVLFHTMGVTGLAGASDIGMMLSVGTLAVLLHRYRLVNIQGLEFGELARALVAAGEIAARRCACAAASAARVSRGFDFDRGGDGGLGGAVRRGAGGTGSKLPRQLLRRKG